MNEERKATVSALGSVAVGTVGVGYALLTGSYSYAVLFLLVATFGIGIYAESPRVATLSLVVGSLVAVVGGIGRLAHYGSAGPLVVVLFVLAAVMGWKARRVRNGSSPS